ncbi:hypothetical protein HDE_08123 [Halotydeus destructor]|nr:hypothetical protein HDE_08123 [Halotydeus destructor]
MSNAHVGQDGPTSISELVDMETRAHPATGLNLAGLGQSGKQDGDQASGAYHRPLRSLLRKPRPEHIDRSSDRMMQPRVSLHGRQIGFHPKHRTRDHRIRKYQLILHNFLERPRGKGPIFYHICV